MNATDFYRHAVRVPTVVGTRTLSGFMVILLYC